MESWETWTPPSYASSDRVRRQFVPTRYFADISNRSRITSQTVFPRFLLRRWKIKENWRETLAVFWDRITSYAYCVEQSLRGEQTRWHKKLERNFITDVFLISKHKMWGDDNIFRMIDAIIIQPHNAMSTCWIHCSIHTEMFLLWKICINKLAAIILDAIDSMIRNICLYSWSPLWGKGCLHVEVVNQGGCFLLLGGSTFQEMKFWFMSPLRNQDSSIFMWNISNRR